MIMMMMLIIMMMKLKKLKNCIEEFKFVISTALLQQTALLGIVCMLRKGLHCG